MKYIIIFKFNLNGINVIYLLTCKLVKTVCSISNHKVLAIILPKVQNLFLWGRKGKNSSRKRWLNLLQWWHCNTQQDIFVQTIHYIDPTNQKMREHFWIYNLDKLHPKGLNLKKCFKAQLVSDIINAPKTIFFQMQEFNVKLKDTK